MHFNPLRNFVYFLRTPSIEIPEYTCRLFDFLEKQSGCDRNRFSEEISRISAFVDVCEEKKDRGFLIVNFKELKLPKKLEGLSIQINLTAIPHIEFGPSKELAESFSFELGDKEILQDVIIKSSLAHLFRDMKVDSSNAKGSFLGMRKMKVDKRAYGFSEYVNFFYKIKSDKKMNRAFLHGKYCGRNEFLDKALSDDAARKQNLETLEFFGSW